ncbi:hypothetical protein DPX16_18580 [Anabarilius grahami]|uniref:Uncharacterized protein n=1 Tax=Anabarilius grahami TaxID=495550 RepID=A0A3N0YAF6_ANAGA|nr:hypothetical protein DPX16_18580 [Anabarilius grahami]
MYRHTASRQLPGSTCSTPYRTGKQKCESLLTLVTGFRCHNVPPRLASRPPWRKLTGSINMPENKPPSTLMSVCATYLQSKCNSDHFEAKGAEGTRSSAAFSHIQCVGESGRPRQQAVLAETTTAAERLNHTDGRAFNTTLPSVSHKHHPHSYQRRS